MALAELRKNPHAVLSVDYRSLWDMSSDNARSESDVHSLVHASLARWLNN